MGRAIAAVVVGYIVMFIVVFVTLTGAYLALGTERAFKAGTYDVTPMWIGIWAVMSLVAAVAGGLVCRVIARGPKPPMMLAGIVLVLGLAMAIPAFLAEPTKEPRGSEVSNLEAMAKAQQPPWTALLNPLVGAAGVVLGGRLKKNAPA